jgi:hypothetical protein
MEHGLLYLIALFCGIGALGMCWLLGYMHGYQRAQRHDRLLEKLIDVLDSKMTDSWRKAWK